MADDKEVLREIWEGRLPICFNISPDEITTVDQPEPCYLLVPRMSYFPLVTDKVFRHFQKASNQDDIDKMWLEYNGQPLKWHYPIGVLYDLHGENVLPWPVTLHFKKFPETEIMKCHGRDAVEAHFMSAVKEADSLKHRSVVINAMKRNDHKQLWMGLSNDRYDQFWSINKKLMERVNSEPFRCIPLRVHQRYKPMLMKFCKSVSEKGELNTLGNFFQTFLPYILDENDHLKYSKNWKVIIQGITPMLNTPLQWMSEHLSHPDNFLHIILIELIC
ncbi:autophagy protein 5 [Hydra vulgaris]|uniref:Autophagy protein 5 n=1 Tax=Hydra vulgaris TaxID=6087 RepID=A0ABM4D7T8_HYDVU